MKTTQQELQNPTPPLTMGRQASPTNRWSPEDLIVLAGIRAKTEKANESVRKLRPATYEEALAQVERFNRV